EVHRIFIGGGMNVGVEVGVVEGEGVTVEVTVKDAVEVEVAGGGVKDGVAVGVGVEDGGRLNVEVEVGLGGKTKMFVVSEQPTADIPRMQEMSNRAFTPKRIARTDGVSDIIAS